MNAPKKYTCQEVQDLPDTISEDTIYIVGKNGHLWYVAMKCPCSCSDIIYLNLVEDTWPYWKIFQTRKGISLNPSVWRTKGCKSHFIVNKGKIIWCNDYNRHSAFYYRRL